MSSLCAKFFFLFFSFLFFIFFSLLLSCARRANLDSVYTIVDPSLQLQQPSNSVHSSFCSFITRYLITKLLTATTKIDFVLEVCDSTIKNIGSKHTVFFF